MTAQKTKKKPAKRTKTIKENVDSNYIEKQDAGTTSFRDVIRVDTKGEITKKRISSETKNDEPNPKKKE